MLKDWIAWPISGEDSGEKMCVSGFMCVLVCFMFSFSYSTCFTVSCVLRHKHKLIITQLIAILKMHCPVVPLYFLELTFWGYMSRSS